MLLVAAFILTVVLYFFFKKHHTENGLHKFPEPPGNFFVGHILQALSTENAIAVTSKFLDYGKTVRLRCGPAACPIIEGLVTKDYNLIEFILSNNKILTKSENYKFLRAWLRNGLLLSDGDYWKRHRKILTPAFHFGILKQFVDVFESVGDIFVKKLEKYEGMSSVDLHPLVILLTLDIISETAMGTKIDVQSGHNSHYLKSVKEICRIVIERAFSPISAFDFSFWLCKDYYKQKKALKVLHGFTSEVLSSKKGQVFEKTTKKMAFLDLLLQFSRDEDVLSNDEIREEVDTFMFEGHDTTAAGICFILYCLADHADVQAKVLQEQKALFGDEKNPTVAYSDLQNMKYLECVIKETCRLYPPVPVIGRYTTEEVNFEGYLIPKRTNIVLFIYALHRNPDFFPEPEKFKPERFENFHTSFPYAYIPFSAGARNCIGQKFAMLEMKSVISKVVRHFEVKPTVPRHELKLSVEAVLKSVNGIKVGLQKRH